MTIKLSTAVAAVGLFAATHASAQMPSVDDAQFVAKAAVGNTLEMEESKLALDHATDGRLKAFARKMIDDHGDAMKKLGDAAGKAGQKSAMMLDGPHQAMVDNLKTFNGTDFDKIYTADQIGAHAETVALLSDYIQNGQNAELKAWAKDALPIVKEHRATINAM